MVIIQKTTVMKTTALIACAILVLASSCMKNDSMPEPSRTNTSVESGWEFPGCDSIKDKRPPLAQPKEM